MRHAFGASLPVHVELDPRRRRQAPRKSSTSPTRTMAVDIPMNRPRSSSLSPWERAGVRAPKAERSNGPNRLPHPLCPCREAQRAGCAWAAQHVHASCSDWPQLFERRCAAAKRVLRPHPAREHRRSPEAKRRVTDSGAHFFCLLFLCEQEKKVRRRAQFPASQPQSSPPNIRIHSYPRPPDKQTSPPSPKNLTHPIFLFTSRIYPKELCSWDLPAHRLQSPQSPA